MSSVNKPIKKQFLKRSMFNRITHNGSQFLRNIVHVNKEKSTYFRGTRKYIFKRKSLPELNAITTRIFLIEICETSKCEILLFLDFCGMILALLLSFILLVRKLQAFVSRVYCLFNFYCIFIYFHLSDNTHRIMTHSFGSCHVLALYPTI